MQNSEHYDAIVIGSGMGGLTTAGLLARVAGMRVLVLEKHLEPGGLTHSFRRDGASWDVGLHYVGQMEPGSMLRELSDFLSDGSLRWNRLPAHHERAVFPGIDFRVPGGAAQLQQLIDAWPEEARAIRQYFRDVKRAARWASLPLVCNLVPKAVVPLLRLMQTFHRTLATQSTSDYMQRHFRSPQLRALLCSPWGDYGLPPTRSAFAMHAVVITHYLEGAWYPDGGSARIARSIETGIEQHGGALRVGQCVRQILIENGRAVGVQVHDTRGPTDLIREYRAPVIVSSAGAALTYGRLLPQEGDIARRIAPVRQAIAALGHGLSAVALFVRLKADARTLGMDGGNLWINTTLDADDIEGHTRDTLAGHPRHVFLSFGSINAGEERFHTAQILCFVEPDAFARWQHADAHRDDFYLDLKDTISTGLLDCVERVVPGFRDQVMYAELSTPLTFEHYSAHPQGCFYGLPPTPERFRAIWVGPRTPVPGLFLSGQDAFTMGIGAAMMGGLAAACQVLGSRGFPRIRAAMRRRTAGTAPDAARSAGDDGVGTPDAAGCARDDRVAPPDAARHARDDNVAPPDAARRARDHRISPPNARRLVEARDKPLIAAGTRLPPGKHRASLRQKIRLTENVWQLDFLLDEAIDRWSAGQFARILVAPAIWRDYSIAHLDGHHLQCLISTRTGGPGSRFVEHAPQGSETVIELPLGRYTLTPSASLKIFVATGTGLAPFLPMFRLLDARGQLQDSILLYGCRTRNDDLSRLLAQPQAVEHAAHLSEHAAHPLPGIVIACYSRATVPRDPHENTERPDAASRPEAAPACHAAERTSAEKVAEMAAAMATETPPLASGHSVFFGRVTDALKKLPIDTADADVYLCGAGAMVADCDTLLTQRGASRVHLERW